LKCCISPLGLHRLPQYELYAWKGRKLHTGGRLIHSGSEFVMNKFPFVFYVREKDYGWFCVTDSHIRSAISRHARSKHVPPGWSHMCTQRCKALNRFESTPICAELLFKLNHLPYKKWFKKTDLQTSAAGGVKTLWRFAFSLCLVGPSASWYWFKFGITIRPAQSYVKQAFSLLNWNVSEYTQPHSMYEACLRKMALYCVDNSQSTTRSLHSFWRVFWTTRLIGQCFLFGVAVKLKSLFKHHATRTCRREKE